jgi:hypothetical protein
MKTIYTALVQYELDNGFAATVGSYGESDGGNWDHSNIGGFMTFLVNDGYLPVPVVDPINDDNYRYQYFCYPPRGIVLKYVRESDDATVFYSGDFGLDPNGIRDLYFSCGNHS